MVVPAAGWGSSMTARQLSDAHVGTSKSELLAQRAYSSSVISAILKPSRRWRIALRHRTCWSHVPWSHVCNRVRGRLLAQRWLYRVADHRLHVLFPPRVVTGPIWLIGAFECIHRYEGAWNANTGNGYFGGLQMDEGFMSTYGPELLRTKGTADNWTPAEQIAVAIRAYLSGRVFGPWPNTSRACGLT